MNLIIHAPNVHQGGGRAILVPLLNALGPGSIAVLDRRLSLPVGLPQGVREIRVDPSVAARLLAEWTLRSLAQPSSILLCFGNLPPLFAVRGKVVLFLQNRYLMGAGSLDGFPVRVRVRLHLERLWLRVSIRNVDTVVVQSPTMQRDVASALGRSASVMPLCAGAEIYPRRAVRSSGPVPTQYDFLFVATGEPHKNHARLLDAWRLLRCEGLEPSLCLTVSVQHYPELARQIERARSEGLKVHNLGSLAHDKVQELYGHTQALIYPSTFESLGLPLIEARRAGLPVVAAELDYVRDVLDPEESFDPVSPLSIARAVKRFLGHLDPPLSLVSPENFLRWVATV